MNGRPRKGACALAAVLLLAGAAPAGAAPAVFPKGTTIFRPKRCWGGYTVLLGASDTALIDMNGRTLRTWERTGLPAYIWPARLMPGGDILKATDSGLVQEDWNGAVVWRLPADPEDVARRPFHHDWQREGSPAGYHAPGPAAAARGGRTLLLRFQAGREPGISPHPLLDCVISEAAWDGRTLWSWSFNEHFAEFGFSEAAQAAMREDPNLRPLPGTDEPPAGDLWHANTVGWLGPNRWAAAGDRRFAPENVISASRQQNIVFIVDRGTGRVVWRLGPDFSATPALRALGQIIGPHHAHMIPQGLPGAGNILLFDNGGFAGYGPPGPGSLSGRNNARRHYSRVLEIDPVSLAVVWEYTAAKAKLPLAQFFSAQTSSAQRLPNGNTLICEGDTGRVFEVTQDHETVWEHLSPRHGQLYRAYRMPYDSLPRRRRPVERPVAPPPDPRRGEAEPIPGQPTP